MAKSQVKKPAFFEDSNGQDSMARLSESIAETELMLASVFRAPQNYPLSWPDSLKKLQAESRQKYANRRQEFVEKYDVHKPPGWARFIYQNPLYLSLGVLSCLALIWMPGRKEKRIAAALGPASEKRFKGWRQPVVKKAAIPVDPEESDRDFMEPAPTEEVLEPEQTFEDRFKHSLKGLSQIAESTLPKNNFEPTPELEDEEVEEIEPPEEDVSVSHFEVLQSKKKDKLEPEILAEDEPSEEELQDPIQVLSDPLGSQNDSSKDSQGSLEDGWEDPVKRAKWKSFEDEENKKITVMKLVRRGSTVSEISQRLKISKTEVELMIRDFKSR